MRLFYAAYLSRENMQAYQALVDQLIEEVPGTLRSVPHQTQHLTLAFLGEIAESDVDICSSVLEAVERFHAFRFSLGPPTILMGRGNPRLIRASVTEGSEQVSEIQRVLISGVSERLLSINSRPKPPHVTVARFNKKAHRPQARQVEDALERHLGPPLPGEDHFSTVHLVKSSLTQSGPIYETVKEVRLSSDH